MHTKRISSTKKESEKNYITQTTLRSYEEEKDDDDASFVINYTQIQKTKKSDSALRLYRLGT